MATYLELVQDLARESGTMDPGAIVSTVGLAGRSEKLAGWVRKAYTNIQNSRRDWGWLTQEFTGTLLPGTATYTPASFNLTRFSNWAKDRDWYMPISIYDPDTGLSDEHHLAQVSYEHWRSRYGRGDQSATHWHRPTEWAVSPKNELVFGPYPDQVYALRGQYQLGPQVLIGSTDIPEMPMRFHNLIVWEAHRLLLIHDGAFNEMQVVNMELVGLRHELEMDQLPEVALA